MFGPFSLSKDFFTSFLSQKLILIEINSSYFSLGSYAYYIVLLPRSSTHTHAQKPFPDSAILHSLLAANLDASATLGQRPCQFDYLGKPNGFCDIQKSCLRAAA